MKRIFYIVILASLVLAACTPAAPTTPAAAGQINILATTSLVADAVRQVGGDYIHLSILLPTGADPHSYEPAPQDVAAIADAAVVFANGAGLESWLAPIIENAGAAAQVVEVSDGIQLLDLTAEEQAEHAAEEGTAAGSGQADAEGNPHVWTDPNNVILWVANIEKALSAADPTHAADYQANAARYTAELKDLDAWVRSQVEQIPAERRVIVTDHRIFGYFADEYGFTQIGAVIPGYSTLSSPSAQEMASIEDAIRKYNVPAVFVGNSVNDSLSQRVAEDTGIQLVPIYTETLSASDGPAATYVDFIRYDVDAFVKALR